MAEINPYIADLYNKVQRLMAWFPIAPGSIGTGTNNTVLATDGSGTPGWRSIVNAMVDAAAGIVASKIAPGNFGGSGTYGFPSTVQLLNASFGYLLAHTGSAYKDLYYDALTHNFQVSAVTKATVGANGITAGSYAPGSIVVGDLASSLYTTGTWSPAIAGTSTAGSNTYSNRDGFYIRFGGFVIAWFQVIMTAKDAAMAGNIYVTMPLTMASASVLGIGSVAGYQNINFAAGQTQLSCLVVGGTTRCELYTGGDNAALANIVAADIAATSVIRGVAIYPI